MEIVDLKLPESPYPITIVGSPLRLWVIPVRRIGLSVGALSDYEVRVKGRGRSVPLYRLSYAPQRRGWYYFSVSKNPGKQVNSLRSPSSFQEALDVTVELAKEVVLTHFKGGVE